MTPENESKRWRNAMALFAGGVITGLLVSKYSALVGFEAGKEQALARIETEQAIRLHHFEQHRMESCLAWWFNDSGIRIRDARVFMCQNKRRWR